jgi:hypothetical protein
MVTGGLLSCRLSPRPARDPGFVPRRQSPPSDEPYRLQPEAFSPVRPMGAATLEAEMEMATSLTGACGLRPGRAGHQ